MKTKEELFYLRNKIKDEAAKLRAREERLKMQARFKKAHKR